MKLCTVDGCSLKARSQSSPYCEKHYMRMYRNGVLERLNVATPRPHSGGYVLIPANGHPLAKGRSHVYEHRAVYYDAHGEGPFACHWCGSEVTWESLHIDHVDDCKTNNQIGNLVASCAICNQARGSWKSPAAWRKKHGIKAFGIVLTASEWQRITGAGRTAIKKRIENGWSSEDAITYMGATTGPKPPKRTEAQTAAIESLLRTGTIPRWHPDYPVKLGGNELETDYRSPEQVAAAKSAALVM